MKDQGYEELEIYDQMTRFKETYIFIVGSIDSADYMECRGRRVYDAMTEYHVGIQLGGNCTESSFFNFTNLSYTDANRIYKPGIGMIPQDNDDRYILQIVIPQYLGTSYINREQWILVLAREGIEIIRKSRKEDI